MTSDRNTDPPAAPETPGGLAKALAQNEHAKELVQESAVDLASANATLKEELDEHPALKEVTDALQKSAEVEEKIHEASGTLTAVNQVLKRQVNDRHALEHQLAALTQQEEASRRASLHDPLTDLPNRALFHDRLEHGLALAKRHDGQLAVMFMDLDAFKLINDTHGHEAGDRVLQTLARRFLRITRDVDTVSRFGGDEFLFLLAEVPNEATVTALATKLIAATALPCDVGLEAEGIQPCVKASIGIALFPKHGTTADGLLRRADAAMYRAKRQQSGYAFAD